MVRYELLVAPAASATYWLSCIIVDSSPTAGHGVELPYVFHTATLGGFHYTPHELVLSDTLINYWTNFARYGNPNGKGEHPVRGIDKFNPQVGGGLQCM